MPKAGLIQASDGNFYGTTEGGGQYGYGTIFKITPNGTLTSLYSFCSQQNCDDGAFPEARLLQGLDGNLYGTTSYGGTHYLCEIGCGTIFRITPAGAITTLYSFCSQQDCTDGAVPMAGLTQAADGDFYGTTQGGGSTGQGTLLKITASGTLTTLYSFCPEGLGNCTDGADPVAELVQSTEGDFYGTTSQGGAVGCDGFGCGTVFKFTQTGELTTLHTFGGQDGADPLAGLVQAMDGSFYGTTLQGGPNNCYHVGCGTIFKITATGVLTTLHSFDSLDGSFPSAPLLQAGDGNLYGTASAGGSYMCGLYNCGTVFKITLTGELTTLHSFDGSDGADPLAGLVQGTDQAFYGATSAGGSYGEGTIFRLAVGQQLVPVTPCRVVDTRNQNGEFGGPPIQGGTYRSFPIPQGACGISPIATTYSLNITVVPHGPLGYLTIWPTGENEPLVSTMNSLDGRIKANAAMISDQYANESASINSRHSLRRRSSNSRSRSHRRETYGPRSAPTVVPKIPRSPESKIVSQFKFAPLQIRSPMRLQRWP
jgi:uncharacterized repeat protein (TIGR03803 family)